MNITASLQRLDILKQRLDAQRPLAPAVVKNLREDLLLRWTYHSNAIEGNTLTLLETKVVLEGVTVGGKPLRDHLEAINHRDAIDYMEACVRDGVLSEHQIRSIHALVLRGIDDANAGSYRSINVTIAGARHVPPDALRIAEKMSSFVAACRTEQAKRHPVAYAGWVHSEFVGIHPFVDGNGRTGRLLMNLCLLQAGYPPAVIPVEQRLDYYAALDATLVEAKHQPFQQLVMDAVERGFEPYWHALGLKVDADPPAKPPPFPSP